MRLPARCAMAVQSSSCACPLSHFYLLVLLIGHAGAHADIVPPKVLASKVLEGLAKQQQEQEQSDDERDGG